MAPGDSTRSHCYHVFHRKCITLHLHYRRSEPQVWLGQRGLERVRVQCVRGVYSGSSLDPTHRFARLCCLQELTMEVYQELKRSFQREVRTGAFWHPAVFVWLHL